MSQMTRVVVLGPLGRMGQEILAAAAEDAQVEVVAAVVRSGHESVGQAAHSAHPGLLVSDDLPGALSGADVLIDFTSPEATLEAVKVAAEAGVATVVGTTGLDESQEGKLHEAAQRHPMVFAPNMSVGVNVMLTLLKAAAKALSDGFDVEVFEAHHRNKVDAPSGTAMRIAQVLCDALERDPKETLVYGRQGVAPRQPGEIGMQVARGGSVAGEHTVFFFGNGERLEITHRAASRRIFADGALRAARWVHGRPNGLYTMAEVLGTA